jgi:hypothetical protein
MEQTQQPRFVMQIPILVERIAGDGYRARAFQPFAVTAKGATRQEALARVREKVESRLKDGTELVGLEVGPETNPWVEFAGMFKDDPLIDEWKKAMAEYRKKVDEDPDCL